MPSFFLPPIPKGYFFMKSEVVLSNFAPVSSINSIYLARDQQLSFWAVFSRDICIAIIFV